MIHKRLLVILDRICLILKDDKLFGEKGMYIHESLNRCLNHYIQGLNVICESSIIQNSGFDYTQSNIFQMFMCNIQRMTEKMRKEDIVLFLIRK
jgi:hypothetical protein